MDRLSAVTLLFGHRQFLRGLFLRNDDTGMFDLEDSLRYTLARRSDFVCVLEPSYRHFCPWKIFNLLNDRLPGRSELLLADLPIDRRARARAGSLPRSNFQFIHSHPLLEVISKNNKSNKVKYIFGLIFI